MIISSQAPIRDSEGIFHIFVAEPPTSCFTVNNAGAVGRPATKLYMVHENTCEYVLCKAQADLMKR